MKIRLLLLSLALALGLSGCANGYQIGDGTKAVIKNRVVIYKVTKGIVTEYMPLSKIKELGLDKAGATIEFAHSIAEGE